MSTYTSKLRLKLPAFTDEVENTIRDLGENFEKLDRNADDFATDIPTQGDYAQNIMIRNANCVYGSYYGWVNTRTGKAAPQWTSVHSYQNGDYIVPTVDNGHVYRCVQSGYSGYREPVFPISEGIEFEDLRATNGWAASTYYQKNDMVLPSVDNGRYYLCIQAGESGDQEPVWAVTDGTTTYDKNAVWASHRIAKWKEIGAAAWFRPFGKIE
ncbi:hypothetical protein SAMN05720606_10883 [Paenibacillus polysaccharolyticus]|uniref:Uncharacterized protein n=1 Tax=Paenibacillus polysaccharolyticus TaxID=582692 RepID=A0A1G5I7D3_9BACL|nr:hypothetical protein [Paenibacillus polysaccharolyticus]SCY71933.1 hypothetical protein SAMN05720606_10883 [Paenibacillus polysaccharolyticus]